MEGTQEWTEKDTHTSVGLMCEERREARTTPVSGYVLGGRLGAGVRGQKSW